MSERHYRLGIDIGGTFTDLSALDLDTHEVHVHKVPSTPDAPSRAVVRGVSELMRRLGRTPASIKGFVHGTTIALNAVLERRGAKIALLVTPGTRDVLELARLRRPNPFDLEARPPDPIAPRSRVFEIGGRVDADGTASDPLDEDALRRALAVLADEGVESVAVCFLNAHANAALEVQAAKSIARERPGLACSRSTALWPEIREYERATVACLNAYVQPVMSRYIDALIADTARIGLDARLYITRSNGGVMSAASARDVPVHTLLSGPASGVVGAAYVARLAGIRDAVTVDIGGTSADVSIIRGGEPVHSTEAAVGDFPVVMPSIDVFAVGAGGGSIAWFDPMGLLKVGPRSAGAAPGPACYGQGGTEPTVTDAYLVCGFINPANFLGGTMKLDRALAHAAVSRVAARLGSDVEAAAESILRVATSNMATALLPMMTKRGIDPRDFTLAPFGGAGATHACLLADDLGIPRIAVPPSPGTLCALGAMIADLASDYIRSLRGRLDRIADADIRGALAELEADARRWLEGEGGDHHSVVIRRAADMRYAGQAFDVEVEIPAEVPSEAVGGALLAGRFHDQYEALFRTADRRAPVELVNLRVRIVGRQKPLALGTRARAANGAQPVADGERAIRYDGRTVTARVYLRDQLLAGHAIDGPAIVEQFDTTTVVAPGYRATCDEYGVLTLARPG